LIILRTILSQSKRCNSGRNFAESDGTFVNNEGRAQRFYQVYYPSNPSVLEAWRWIGEMIEQYKLNGKQSLKNFSDFSNALAESYPEFKSILEITPPPGFRIAGEKFRVSRTGTAEEQLCWLI